MNPGDRDIKSLRVPLTKKQQIFLMRHIEAEKVEPNFIKRGLSNWFTHEIFLYCYFACHGCSDHRQKVLLNERDIDKIFWNPEY